MKQGTLREHAHIVETVLRVCDLTAVTLAALVSYTLYFKTSQFNTIYSIGVAIGVLCTLAVFRHFTVYRTWRGTSIFNEIKVLSQAWSAVFVILSLIYFVTGSLSIYPLEWLLLWMLLAWMFLVIFHTALRLALRQIRRRGFNQRSVILIGYDQLCGKLARQLTDARWAGLKVLGFFDERGADRITPQREAPYLGTLNHVDDYLRKNDVDQIWLAYPLRAENRVQQVVHRLRHCPLDVRYALDIDTFRLFNHSITEVASVPVLTLSESPLHGMRWLAKSLEDFIFASLLLLLTSPLFVIIAIGVKLSSPGPVFYRQERVSWNNKPFTMLKFRSMPVEAEAETGPVWNSRNDRRATEFGAFLRRTSLDELPQLINVLRGEMSLVGPRPERPYFVEKYKDEIPDYMKKHMVKAGITGWAQINGWRGNTDLKKRIEYDLYYIKNWSIWFDLKILFLTPFKGLVHRNAY